MKKQIFSTLLFLTTSGWLAESVPAEIKLGILPGLGPGELFETFSPLADYEHVREAARLVGAL